MDSFFYYSDDHDNFDPFMETAKITLNGHDRIKERDEKYFVKNGRKPFAFPLNVTA